MSIFHHPIRALARYLREPTVLSLVILFCSGAAIMLWYVVRMQSRLVQATATTNAARYSEALGQFRTLYTSEVVERVRSHGVTVSHDYEDHEGAIPLPATLSMRLGQKIGEQGTGTQSLAHDRSGPA